MSVQGSDPYSRSEAQRQIDETAGIRQSEAKSTQQAALLRELGEDAEPTDQACFQFQQKRTPRQTAGQSQGTFPALAGIGFL